MGQKKTDTYDVIYSSIRRITKLRTAEGEIRFTATMKLIYAYIWTFQENKGRGNNDPIHTNTNVIAWEIGVSEKTVIDALKALDDAGVVIKRTEKVRGNVNSSNYVAIPPASVAALGITPPHPNESISKPKKKKAAEPTNEEKKGDGEQAQQQEHEQQSPGVASLSATDDPEQQSGVSQPAGDSGDAISSDDGVTGKNIVKMPWIESPFDNGRLVSEARHWAQSQGATAWQDEIKLVWKLTGKTNIGEPGEHMRPDDVPAPEPAKQKANGYTLYEGTPKEPDWNDDEQF